MKNPETFILLILCIILGVTIVFTRSNYKDKIDKSNNTIEVLEKKKDSLKSIIEYKDLEEDSLVLVIQEIRSNKDSIINKQLKDRKYYEKVINSIDTFNVSELQRYFTKRYPR